MQNIKSLAAAVLPILLTPVLANDERRLCEQSSRGQQACLERLEAFTTQNHQLPLADDELYQVYGCLLPVSQGKGAEQEMDYLACDQDN